MNGINILESKRVIVSRDNGVYAVDIWTRGVGTFFTQAQQLFIQEYRVSNATSSIETEAINLAVDGVISKYGE